MMCNVVGSVLEYHLKWICPILVSIQQWLPRVSFKSICTLETFRLRDDNMYHKNLSIWGVAPIYEQYVLNMIRKMKSLWCCGTCNIVIHLRSPQEPPQPAAMGRDAISRNLWSLKGRSKVTHFVGCSVLANWNRIVTSEISAISDLLSAFMQCLLESRIKMLRYVALGLKVRKRSCPKLSNIRVKWSLLTLPCTTIASYEPRKK